MGNETKTWLASRHCPAFQFSRGFRGDSTVLLIGSGSPLKNIKQDIASKALILDRIKQYQVSSELMGSLGMDNSAEE